MEEKELTQLISTVSNLPLVKIDRTQYLRKEFGNLYPNLLEEIIEKGPYMAGVPVDVIKMKCEILISYETNKSTFASFGAGLPGGFAMIATIPADITQFMVHTLRICQGLSHLCSPNIEGLTDEEQNIFLMHLGIMFGIGSASIALAQFSKAIAPKIGAKVTQSALTKTPFYQLVKKIATQIGAKMTKQIAGKGVSKAVPILGGLVSGAITYVSLKKMSDKLYKELININFNQ